MIIGTNFEELWLVFQQLVAGVARDLGFLTSQPRGFPPTGVLHRKLPAYEWQGALLG